MASEFDPTSETYLDEKSVRDELTRVFDVCIGCRQCTDFCGSFTSLFDQVEPHREAGRLTPAQQDDVVDRCFQCDACVAVCPYTPGQHELAIDVPKLIIRSAAMRADTGQRLVGERRAAAVLGRPDRVGRIGTRFPSVSNAIVGAPAGSVRRRLLSSLTGVSKVRQLPTFATQRFSHWFRARVRARDGGPIRDASRVVIYPTCMVEHSETGIGKDIVAVVESGGAACVLSMAGCCGASSLHAGDTDRFATLATRAVTKLAQEIRQHGEVILPQATCASALRRHAVDHVAPSARADAEFVARRLAERSVMSRDMVAGMTSPLAGRSVLHVEQAPGSGAASCELLRTAGATVTTVRVGVGITSTWGLRASNDAVVASQGRRSLDLMGAAGDTTTSEDVLANQAIFDQIDVLPVHPFQSLAHELDRPTDSDR